MRSSILDALEPRRLFNGPGTVAIGDAYVIEGNAGERYADLLVSLSGRSNKSVSVNYVTANGTAIAGGDYVAVSGKLTFAPGETSKSIRIPIKGDRLPEADESFVVSIKGEKGTKVSRGRGTVTINDDEPRIAISGWASYNEGDFGTTPFNFTVSLPAAYDQPVTVGFATQDSSAVADDDYLAASGTLTFAPGETSKTITVTVNGDTSAEGPEYFYVNLSNASANASISSSSAYGSIEDDDGYYYDPGYYDPGYYYDYGPYYYYDYYYYY